MGCDGGTLPTRGEQVRQKEKKEQVDSEAFNAVRWRLCALTKEPLQRPIVADPLGRVMNKEAVIEALLTKSLPEGFEYIRGLKDLLTLNLTPNPAADAAAPADQSTSSPFICPITRMEMAGRVQFAAFQPCGCVVSEKAIRAVSDKTQCIVCNRPVASVQSLNPPPEDIESIRAALELRRLQSAKERKPKAKKLVQVEEKKRPRPQGHPERPGEKRVYTATRSDPISLAKSIAAQGAQRVAEAKVQSAILGNLLTEGSTRQAAGLDYMTRTAWHMTGT